MGMDTDDGPPAIIEPVATSAPADAEDSLAFVRGLVYCLACAVPFWGVVVAAVWLAL